MNWKHGLAVVGLALVAIYIYRHVPAVNSLIG